MIVLAEAEWTPHRGEFTFFDGARHPVRLDGLRTADGPPSCHRAVVDDDDPVRGTARGPDLVARDELLAVAQVGQITERDKLVTSIPPGALSSSVLSVLASITVMKQSLMCWRKPSALPFFLENVSRSVP